jgi:hypothetical protein
MNAVSQERYAMGPLVWEEARRWMKSGALRSIITPTGGNATWLTAGTRRRRSAVGAGFGRTPAGKHKLAESAVWKAFSCLTPGTHAGQDAACHHRRAPQPPPNRSRQSMHRESPSCTNREEKIIPSLLRAGPEESTTRQPNHRDKQFTHSPDRDPKPTTGFHPLDYLVRTMPGPLVG